MKKLISKVKSILKKNNKYSLLKKNIKENRRLRKNKISDLKRWGKSESLFQDWDERTKMMSAYIKPNANIIEFGAGSMFLKSSLKDSNSYTPAVIVKRDEETVVCDLNKPIDFDLSKYDVAIFSGVLEYVFDIDEVFKELNGTMEQVILSYACADIVSQSRENNGWLSDYTKIELEIIFNKYNYKVKNYLEWRKQSIFNLIKY